MSMREDVKEGYEKADYKGEYRENREVRGAEEELFRKLFDKMPDKGEILDLGCGTGLPFDKYFVDSGYSVTGVDIAENHVDAARENVPGAEFVQGDFFDIDSEAGFDAIVSFYAIFHIPRDEHGRLFEHMSDLLKENGLILVTVAGEETDEDRDEFAGAELIWSSYSQERNRNMIEEAGFSILDVYEEVNGEEHHLWILAEKKSDG